MDSLQGQLLVATNDLHDPNFQRTVILLVTHNDQGALGLVLNRQTNVPLHKAWSQLSESPCIHKTLLYLGGPCQGPLMALHTRSELSDCEVRPDLFFTAKPEELTTLVETEEGPIRFFVGYAGWGPGQLENELREGSWRTGPAENEHAFGDADRLWEQVSKRLADVQMAADLRLKHVPPDVRLN